MAFNKKPRLPKFSLGGSKTRTLANGNVVSDASDSPANSATSNIYNDKRSASANIGQYAQIAGQGAVQLASINNSDMSEQDKNQVTNQFLNGTADAVITQTPGFGQYYGAAKGASDLGKSMLAKDEYGNYKTGVDKAGNEIMTADHSAMINDISNKNYVALGLDSMGIGKFGRMFSDVTGNSQQTTGGWGKFNKAFGITPDKQAMYAMGGLGTPNAEVEKQENSVTPDGEFTQFNGPSHEQGGIPVQLDPKEMVFSDRLKFGKKTFAELNKVNNTNKEDKLMESNRTSPLTKRTAELLKMAKVKNSTQLFEAQEALKHEKVAKYAQRMGVSMPSNEMRYGGMPKFPWGGTKKGSENQINDLNSREQGEYQNWFNQGSRYATDNNEEFNADEYSLDNYRKTFNPIAYNKGMGTSESPTQTSGINPQGQSNKIDWGNIGSNIAMGLANNAGNIYNLSRYNKPEVEKYDRAQASYLNSTAAMRDADQETKRTAIGVKNASGGNAANYLANRVALQTQNTMNKAKIRENYDNANAQIGNQNSQFNTNISMAETIANAQNRARNRSGKGEAIGSIGFNTANQMRDNKMQNMDQDTLNMMMKYYDTPEFQKIMKDNKFQRKTGK